MIELHILRPDDWMQWRRMRLAALENAPDSFGSSLVQWQAAGEAAWRDRLGQVPYNVMASVGGEPAGQASGTAVDRGEAELISMWVAPTERGRGVGDALVRAVADDARVRGAGSLRLSVRRLNQPAIALYLRNGFIVSGPGDEDSEIGMVLHLSGEQD